MSGKSKIIYLDVNKLPEPLERFVLHEVIAEGNFAQVYRATDTANGNREVAVKILENLPELMTEAEEEFRILKDLSHHKNFCEFFGAFVKKCGSPSKDQLWFVMEYCSGGSVANLSWALFSKGKKLPESIISYILKEVINGLSHLHRNHIMHRDVIGNNILINAEGVIKITDFGFSRHMKHTMSRRSTSIGSPYWMAPEIIANFRNNGDGYDNHCDVWSLGITAIEMGDGEPPLANVHPVRAIFQIVNNPPPTLKKITEWTSTYNDFVAECLVKNPDHRPVIMELLEHPFIQEVPEDHSKITDHLKKLISETKDATRTSRELVVKNGQVKEGRLMSYKAISPENLITVEDINDEKLLKHLQERYDDGKYHTYAGDVLVIINPHKENDIYNEEFHERFKCKTLSDEEPHIFAIVDKAWQDMLHHKEHQNIILTGFKNSGKTHNFNAIVRHLCYIAHGNEAMAKKIEQLPFLLDAFGNAATETNKNSTRHVRYLELTFTETGKISGAVIALYLLEKWRVTSLSHKDERNFHIFYYFFYGLKQNGGLEKYFLNGRNKLKFLPVAENAETERYIKGYEKFVSQLDLWDLEESEKEFLFKTIAAILLLGEIEFVGEDAADIANKDLLANVASLLQVDDRKLSEALLKYQVLSNGGSDLKCYSVFEADAACSALARGLYSRLVDWIVNTLNVKLCTGRIVFGDYHSLAVIDSFGFEDCGNCNSMEQFIANLTNEQFLYHYNQHVFAWEMQDYRAEGIEMEDFDFQDNRPLLDTMLSKPEGVLAFLDEECRSSGNPTKFLDALNGFIRNDHLQTNLSKLSFAVKHFGGWVSYDTQHFIEKNRDFLAPELTHVMRESSSGILASLFSNQMTKTGHVTVEVAPNQKQEKRESKMTTTKKFNTVSKGRYSQSRQMQTLSMQLRHSFIELLQKFVKGTPHFVRCINPSKKDIPEFNPVFVLSQLEAFGVKETIRIRQRGFSYRVPFNEFLRRYQFLAFDFDESVEMTSDNCRLLLVRLRMEGWALGKSKILLRYYDQEYLSRLYEAHMKKIVKVQSVIRTILARKLKQIRGQDDCKWRKSANISPEEAAAIAIQKNFRGFQARKEYSELVQRRKFQSETVEDEAAHIIQYFWRKWKAKTLFQQLLLYRADKQQQMIYFCQQVHLYNQEICGHFRHSSESIDLSKIVEKNRSETPIPTLPKVKKIPLNLKNRHFLNTTFMCAASFIKAANKNDNEVDTQTWDTPVRKHSPLGNKNPSEEIQKNPPASILRKTPERTSPIPVPEKKSPLLSPVSKSPSPVSKPPSSGPAVKFKVGEWQTNSSENSKCQIAPKLKSPTQPTTQRSLTQEMQHRAASSATAAVDTNPEAPFNFQGMLRKTNYARESMRRSRQGNSESNQKFSSKTEIQPEASRNGSGSDSGSCVSPSKYELAPGLVIEGEEADL